LAELVQFEQKETMAFLIKNETKASLGLRILPNILACAIGLGAAYLLDWTTTDLVWSLWLSSLVLGYTTILSAVGGGAYVAVRAMRNRDFNKKHLVPAIIGGTLIGLFFFGFFSIHFGGFHAVHSVFLSHFFPVEDLPDDGFGQAFMNPPLLWVLVFRHLMRPYGIFLVPALIAERNHVFKPLIGACAAVRNESLMSDASGNRNIGKKGNREFIGDAMGRPYVNVVRMHLLISIFIAWQKPKKKISTGLRTTYTYCLSTSSARKEAEQ